MTYLFHHIDFYCTVLTAGQTYIYLVLNLQDTSKKEMNLVASQLYDSWKEI